MKKGRIVKILGEIPFKRLNKNSISNSISMGNFFDCEFEIYEIIDDCIVLKNIDEKIVINKKHRNKLVEV